MGKYAFLFEFFVVFFVFDLFLACGSIDLMLCFVFVD